ncbi:hypothetical protein AMATHDRAFT_49063 [Amanita thiersii Skay4041]|uniref:Uncharacterized protein n=1 Tax=Amanita thiersii Skay4041 TaxID=703135 RepID=A0A2A9NI74_9AGAR|nr:hypothetical protein AMATHDRAFT_49063 [Amanita thiersii Skay4041]
MKKYGYNTTDELDKGVQSILKGEALEEYEKVKKQMEGADEAIAAVFQITSVIGAATGIFLGVVVVLGIMTGGAAFAALGIVAELWLDEPLISDNESLMKKKLEGDFATDYNKSKRTAVVSVGRQFLEKYDSDRGAWTNEDPDWKSGDEDIIASISAASKSAAPSRAKRSIVDTEKADMEKGASEPPTASYMSSASAYDPDTLATDHI